MESGLMMVLHSLIIGLFLFLVMFFVLGQKQAVAENRSILLAAFILIYMIVSIKHPIKYIISFNLIIIILLLYLL